MKNQTLLSLAILPFLAGNVFADGVDRDLTVEQATAAAAGVQRPGSLRVAVTTDRADATYATGETVRLFLNVNEDAFVTVLNIGASGKVTQLFPNRAQPDGKVSD